MPRGERRRPTHDARRTAGQTQVGRALSFRGGALSFGGGLTQADSFQLHRKLGFPLRSHCRGRHISFSFLRRWFARLVDFTYYERYALHRCVMLGPSVWRISFGGGPPILRVAGRSATCADRRLAGAAAQLAARPATRPCTLLADAEVRQTPKFGRREWVPHAHGPAEELCVGPRSSGGSRWVRQ
jgi:hypothetical protein